MHTLTVNTSTASRGLGSGPRADAHLVLALSLTSRRVDEGKEVFSAATPASHRYPSLPQLHLAVVPKKEN